jgi:hypothetical protein
MREKVNDLLRRSEWNELTDVRHGDVIACLVDGELVEGKVSVSPKDLSVQLYGRDMQLCASAHIMLMAPKIYTVEPWIGSSVNDYGILRLKELLIGLYHDYRVISQVRGRLAAILPDFLAAKDRYNHSISKLNERRSALKKSFKACAITQREYMLEVNKVRKAVQDAMQVLKEDFQNMFSPMLSDCVHCDNLMQVIENLPLQ